MAVLLSLFIEDAEAGPGCLLVLVVILAGLVALITGGIGVIRFVKWAWGG